MDPGVIMATLFLPTGCFPPCFCPDKPLRTRIAWLPGSTFADLPELHPSPSVVLAVQIGVLAKHAVNPGQDPAQSLSLHLGKMETELYLGFVLIQTLTVYVPGAIKMGIHYMLIQ